MFRLAGLIITIGLADSLNPTTIAPALYLASGPDPRRKLGEFTFGVFAVYLLGGAAITLGPGSLVLAILPHPRHDTLHIIEVIGAAVMLTVSILVWRHRGSLVDRTRPQEEEAPRQGASMLLGATITAVELPTAFPYFAAIAAIVGADIGPGREIVLLLLFNLAFVLPLLGILATLWLAGDHAAEILTRAREFLQRHWPAVLAGAALLAGLVALFVGVTGLLVAGHGDVNNTARTLRKLLHLSPRP